jgi:multidrug efflux pump subunit AcrA (membrane-fusion protein)
MPVFNRHVFHRTALLLMAPGLLLAGCDLVASPTPAQSRLFPGQAQAAVEVAGARAPSNALPPITNQIKRGSLTQSLSIPGRVVPTRAAQLTLHGGGVVQAVNVKSGQQVKQGDVLVEFALDDETLELKQVQATLAELAAESQEAKVAELKSGADATAVAQLEATLASDRVNIERIQQDQAAAAVEAQRLERGRDAAQKKAERSLAVAEITLQDANDQLAASQAQAKRVQDEIAKDKEAARKEAQVDVEGAEATVRGAERRVQLAQIRLSQVQLEWAGTRASHDVETRQLSVDQAKEALESAREAEAAAREQTPGKEQTQRQIDAQIKSAAASVRSAERALEREQLALDYAQNTLPALKSTDDADIKTAAMNLEQAKEDLARAQKAQARAAQRLEDIEKPRDSDQAKLDAAQAAIRVAQRKVDTETRNVEEAQADQEAGADEPQARTRTFDTALAAARAQLNADQARMDALQSGASANSIQREEIRAKLLREQADAALAAAQPVVVLTAPFDSVVTDVGVRSSQTIGRGGATPDSDGTAIAGAAESGADRFVAVRLASNDVGSVLANASEADVAQFRVGQPVNLTFPGLAGATASGRITDIGGTPISSVGKVAYPVRVDVESLRPDIKMGMTAQIDVTLTEAQDVLIAPREAIRTVDGRDVVSRIVGDKLEDVVVQVGRTYGSQVEIVSGVQEGDIVAVYSLGMTASPQK